MRLFASFCEAMKKETSASIEQVVANPTDTTCKIVFGRKHVEQAPTTADNTAKICVNTVKKITAL